MKNNSALLSSIGNTPLLRLSNIEEKFSLSAKIYAKLERSNPTGSVKDRASKYMIIKAIERGDIDEETIIIEPTSGNTGISLSAIAASLSLRIALYMPENVSRERVLMMQAFGAEVVLTPKARGMKGAVEEAMERAKREKKSFLPFQFANKDNALAHYETTGKEIENELGNIDIFLAGFGTGGTLMGTGKYLKEKNPNITLIGVEPKGSPLVTSSKAGPHKIQGIGANFIPDILDVSSLDEVLDIEDEEAYEGARLLAKTEGLLVGISSGANIMGAIKVASRAENAGKIIVTVLPDNGERYLSVEGLF